MAESVYRILDQPWVYNLVQRIVGAGADRLEGSVYRRLFADSRGLVLDVGCGPRPRTPAPRGIVVGLDAAPEYVRAYSGAADAESGATPRRLGAVGFAERLPFADGVFDEVRCRAILHHMSPDAVRQALAEMLRVVKPSGRVVVMDGVWPIRRWQYPIGWLMLRLDRGDFVRSADELAALADDVAPGGWRRFRYTAAYLGQQAVVLLHEPPRPAAASSRDPL